MIQVRFGGYDFGQQVEQWREVSNIVMDAASVPTRDGLLIRGGKMGPREIELRGSLMAASETALRDLRDALRNGILNKTDDLTLMDDRFVKCRVTSYADDFVPGSGLTVMRFSTVLTSDLPYEQTVALQSSGAQTTTTSGNTDFNVTNNGNRTVWAKVTVTAPGGGAISNNLSVANLSRSESFEYLGDIAAGESLVVDGTASPPTVENDGVDDTANFDGQYIRLAPGTNVIRVVTDVGAEILIQWRDAWI